MSNSTKPAPEKIGEARLDLVPQLADCRPGIRPVEYNVIVAPAPSTEASGKGEHKIGSIFIPDEAKDTLDLAMQVGRIVSASPHAFGYERAWPEGTMPVVGDLVWFARYGGKEFEGADGKTYRILKDKDIGAVIEAPNPAMQALADFAASENARTSELLRLAPGASIVNNGSSDFVVVAKPFEFDSFPQKEAANG